MNPLCFLVEIEVTHNLDFPHNPVKKAVGSIRVATLCHNALPDFFKVLFSLWSDNEL